MMGEDTMIASQTTSEAVGTPVETSGASGLYADEMCEQNAGQAEDDLPSTADELLEWYEEMGFSAIPLPSLNGRDYLDLHVLDDEHGNPVYIDEPWSENAVGLATGSASLGRYSVVLHRSELTGLADLFLPEAFLLHSCKDSRKQHRWFDRAPIPATRVFKDSNGNPLAEIRAEGCVTLAPGSIHAFGERIVWHGNRPVNGELRWDSETIEEAVENFAACSELVRNWPTTPFNIHCAAATAYMLLQGGTSYAFADYFVIVAAIHAGESLNTIWEIRGVVESVANGLAEPTPLKPEFRLADCIGERPAQVIADCLRLNEKCTMH